MLDNFTKGSFKYRKQSNKSTNFLRELYKVIRLLNRDFFLFHFIVPPSPPPEGDTQSVLPFPWHLIPFMVIIFILIVIFIAHYLRIADIIDAIILILKDKKRKEKASKKEKRNLDMIKGNFSTAGFKASTFHSYQRELFYEDALNFSLFENTKAIEFSIQLDEEHQSSESRESVEIACVMGEESRDTKPLSDSLSEMFDPVETH